MTEKEREMDERKRERNHFHHWFSGQWLQRQGLDKGKVSSQNSMRVSLHGSSTWLLLCCVPRQISSELDQRQRSWHSNWCSDMKCQCCEWHNLSLRFFFIFKKNIVVQLLGSLQKDYQVEITQVGSAWLCRLQQTLNPICT